MERRNRAWIAAFMISVAGSIANAGVTDSIDALLKDPYLKNVSIGIKILRLSDSVHTSSVVYEHDSTRPLIPASNLKLVTTAAALETLGADFHFETKLLQKGNTLALVGDGDPTLGDAAALKKVNWQSTTLFQKWAEGLSARGLKSADALVYDDSIFDAEYTSANWPANQMLLDYVAGVAGLNFNANCLDFFLKPASGRSTVDYTLDPPTNYFTITNTCVKGTRSAVTLARGPAETDITLGGQADAANTEPWAITVANPPAFAAAVLRDVFAAGGITINGQITRDPTVRENPAEWRVVAVNRTPIDQVIARANTYSINLYAEALNKRLGAAVTKQPGSRANGAAAVGAFLQSIGVPPDQFSLDDGCGLSRKNTVSAASLAAVIQHEYFSPNREIYLGSLAIAGGEGTLRNRFTTMRSRERVSGKSGFIEGVSALSGFIQARDGSNYLFTILFNGIAKGSNNTAKQMQERIVLTLDN